MKKASQKVNHVSDHEFKTLLGYVEKKYSNVLRRLAKGPHRITSDEEVKRKFSNLEKRYKGLYDDLAKT